MREGSHGARSVVARCVRSGSTATDRTEIRVARLHLHTELILHSGRRIVWVETTRPKLKRGLPLGGGCCSPLPVGSFLANGTQIQLADGSNLSLAQMEIGLSVATGDRGAAEVTGFVRARVDGSLMDIVTEDGSELLASPNARLDTPGGLTKAADLEAGDEVLTEAGPTTVLGVSIEAYDGLVSEILVGDNLAPPTIVANGLLVATGSDTTSTLTTGTYVSAAPRQLTQALGHGPATPAGLLSARSAASAILR